MKTQKLDSRIYHSIKKIRIAVLIMGTAILFYACNDNEIQKIQAFHSTEDLPILEINNFESLITDSGVIRHSIKAPLLLQFENDGKSFLEFPKGIEIIEFDANRNITSTITAEYAQQFPKEQKWEAKNNVVVTNVKGDSLKTEHLILEEKAEKIYTEEFVKIISDSRVITGIGLTSDQNMKNWKIKNPKGKLYIDVKEKHTAAPEDKQNTKPENTLKTTESVPQTLKFK